jgi:threonine/homoserine/homoserine lactone efflux protein
MAAVNGALPAFVALAVVVIVTPGPDTALTIRNTISGGRRAGLGTAAGVSSGLTIWTLATAAGVSALLVASEPAFLALKYAGAAYLVFLGLQTLVGALVRRPHDATPLFRRAPLTPTAALRQGLLNDLANPKIAVFFSSLLPQFAPASGPAFPTLLALGLLFCAMTFAWLTVYAAAIDRLSALLTRTAVRRAIDAVMGTVLIALGGRLALEPR